MAEPKCRVTVDWETIQLLHQAGARAFDVWIDKDIWQTLTKETAQGEVLADTLKRLIKEAPQALDLGECDE